MNWEFFLIVAQNGTRAIYAMHTYGGIEPGIYIFGPGELGLIVRIRFDHGR